MPEAPAAISPSAGGGQRTVWLTIGVLLLSAAAWIGAVTLMNGMAMPFVAATARDGLVFFGVWVVMMAAMMLPSALPMFRFYGGMAHSSPPGFVSGYLLVWAAAGAVAYAGYVLARGGAVSMPDMNVLSRPVAIGLVLAAAIYQASPLKSACLRHCRSPLAFVINHWRDGSLGALRMGLEHGLWCFGCCAGLMALLFAVGVMNVGWMALLAAVILAEKTLPGGPWLARGVSAALGVLAVVFAASPDFYALVTSQPAM